MKKFIMMALIFVFILPISAIAETLRIGTDHYLPFNGTAGTKEEGYVIEIIRAVFSEHKLEFASLPYARGLSHINKGKIDILLTVAKNQFPDTTDLIFPREEISIIRGAFFVRQNNNWKYKGPDSLKGVRVGLVNSYEYPEIEDKLEDKRKFDYISGANTTQRNLKKLLKDRIDTYYESDIVVKYYAKKMGIAEKIKIAGYGREHERLYIVISAKNNNAKKIADKFDTEIRQLRITKHLDQILQRYNLKDWK